MEITKNGVKEWWVQVKTSSGLTGWICAGKLTGGRSWGDPNFADLCMLN